MGTLVFQATLGGSVNLIGPNTASTINFTLPSADGTSGQALTTNGSGTLSFATVTTGAAGSTTQVQYNSSGAFAGSANLTFNGTTLTAANTSITTSETLSYGTANGVTYLNGSKVLTSGSALTFDGNQIAVTPVSGNAVSKLFGGTGAGVGSYFAVYAQGANSGYFGTDSGVTGSGTSNDLTIYPASTNNIRFYQSGAEQMRLTSTGLGIGTSSPKEKLDSRGAAVFSGDNATGTNAFSTSAGVLLSTASDGSNARITAVSNGNNNVGLLLRALNAGSAASSTLLLDYAGNLGLGVTPSAWGIGKALQVNNASLMGYLNRLYANANTYFDGTGTGKYIASDYATSYQQVNGTHAWFNAASGTAGNAISFTQAMTLDASGNLLVGTTSDAIGGNRVLVQSAATANNNRTFSVYNTAATSTTAFANRIAQLSSSGSGADVTLQFTDQAAYNCYIGMGSGNLYFATNGTTERARIDSSGNLLVGTTTNTPAQSNVSGFKVGGGQIECNGSNTQAAFFGRSNDGQVVRFYNAGSAAGNISNTSTVTTYNGTSDYRLKENIQPMEGGLEKILALKPVTYTWKNDGRLGQGFIAHELQEVIPDAVQGEKDAIDENGNPEYQGIDPRMIVATLTAAIQELKAEFDAYKASHS